MPFDLAKVSQFYKLTFLFKTIKTEFFEYVLTGRSLVAPVIPKAALHSVDSSLPQKCSFLG